MVGYLDESFEDIANDDRTKQIDKVDALDAMLAIGAPNQSCRHVLGKLNKEDGIDVCVKLIEYGRYTMVEKLITRDGLRFDSNFI